LTKNSIKTRFASHAHRAKTSAARHPFYAAIRKYGSTAFTLTCIDTATTALDAGLKEQWHIANSDSALLYNVSPGGSADGVAGAAAFWSWLNANPLARHAYIAKLSATKKANDWSDYAAVSAHALAWRKAHPKEAYAISRRASRVARTNNGAAKPKVQKSLKDRLLLKHKPRQAKAQTSAKAAFALWARRTQAERADLAAKISQAQQSYWDSVIDIAKRQSLTQSARDAVDRKKQGAAASVGLKAYWVALKADPEALRLAMATRVATRNKNASL
jgi:hypothetical protein